MRKELSHLSQSSATLARNEDQHIDPPHEKCLLLASVDRDSLHILEHDRSASELHTIDFATISVNRISVLATLGAVLGATLESIVED
ncbi:hypothetical protein Tco_0149160 [Tanacetum coccineum]